MELISFVLYGTDEENKIVIEKSIGAIELYKTEIIEVDGSSLQYIDLKKKLNGKYMIFISNSDFINPERVSEQITYLEKHPDIDAVGGGISIIDDEGTVLALPAFVETEPYYLQALSLFECPMNLGTLLIRVNSIHDDFIIDDWDEDLLCRRIIQELKVTNLQINAISKKQHECTDAKQIERTYAILNAHQIRIDEETLRELYTDGTRENSISHLEKIYAILKDIIEQAQNQSISFLDELIFVCRNFYLKRANKLEIAEKEALEQIGSFLDIQNEEYPLVSVIIPTYNRSNLVKESIKSVLNQTYRNLEVIVVDDCSTDATEKNVLALMERDHRIIYKKNTCNGGPGACRNLGAKIAKGSYLAFHDDDDVWHIDKLQVQMHRLLNDKAYDMSFSRMTRYMNGKYYNTVLDEFDWYNRKDVFFQEEIKNNYIGAPTVVIKKNCFEKIGGFDENLRCLEDWDFAIRAAQQCTIDYVPTSLMDVNILGDSVSNNANRYIFSWSKILCKFIHFADNKGEYINLMRKHLRNVLYNCDDIEAKLQYAHMCLCENSIDKSIVDVFLDEDEINNFYLLKDYQAKCVFQDNELTRMQCYNDELKQEVANMSAYGDELKQEIVNMSAYEDELKQEIANMSAYEDELKQEITNMSAYEDELKQEITNMSAYEDELKQEITNMSAYEDELKQEIINMAKYQEVLKNEINKMAEYGVIQQREIQIQMDKAEEFQKIIKKLGS